MPKRLPDANRRSDRRHGIRPTAAPGEATPGERDDGK
jgi:hypothetical protein